MENMNVLNECKKDKLLTTANMAKIALLSALAVILMQFEIGIPTLFLEFLKLEFSEVPAIVGTLAVNPLAGIVIIILKNLLKVIISTKTAGIGEFANMIISIGYILPLVVVMRKKTLEDKLALKNLLLGLGLGVLSLAIIGALANYFILIPMYSTFMPMDTIIEMGTTINPAMVDKFTLVLYGIVPFNLFKGVLISTVGIIIVKAMKPIFKYLVPKQH